LLAAGRNREAREVFEDDLAQYPMNGWSMFGLARAMRAEGDDAEANEVLSKFNAVWQFADIELDTSIL
jgi:TolA-binding protein